MPDPEGKPSGGPPARRIDRDALERIIQRAAELQAGDVETGDSLTEQELLKLGAEVGIDGRFLRQALYEEAAGGRAEERGFLAKWFGPGGVAAGRVVPGDKAQVEAALEQWMIEGEALAVKRRMPDRTVWEKQRGFFADMKRGFGVGGKSYMLSRAHDVAAAVTQLEPGYCHVELSADLRERRGGAVTGVSVGSGVLLATSAGLIGVLTPVALPLMLVALAPLAGAIAAPIATARSYQRFASRVQLALEQVLDRLERGEVKPRHRGSELGDLLFVRVAGEFRRAFGDVQRPRRNLPPGTPKP